MDHKRRKNDDLRDESQPVWALKFTTGFLLIIGLWLLSACRAQVTETRQVIQTESKSQLESSPTSTHQSLIAPTSTRDAAGIISSRTPDVGGLENQIGTATLPPTSTQVETATPAPTIQPTPVAPSPTLDSAYPGPIQLPPESSGQSAYPGPYPQPVQTGSSGYPASSGGIFGAGEQSNPTVVPTQTQASQISAPSPTLRSTGQAQLPTLTPLPAGESGVFSPLSLSPLGSNLTIKIWHSLEYPKQSALKDIIRAFQQTFPQVSFEMTYIPLDDLKQSYTAAVYQRSGPDLLLAPSEWSGELFDLGLAADLSGYFQEQFWGKIVPVALETGKFRQAQVSLPITMSGVVLYRNSDIIPKASPDYASMAEKAKLATRSGVVGSYFDLDPLYSMAHLDGLGGIWQDSSGKPIFNRQNYASGLSWLKMLQDFDQMGAVELNTSRDLSLFRQAKVGLIIDGTWNLESLSLTLGDGNLAIDPWPTYGSGKLSGYVFTQGLYLSSETASKLDENLIAALQFIGAALSPQSQQRLVEESTFLPVLKDFQVSDSLKKQAMVALEGGTAFPTELQDKRFEVYRAALQTAINQTFGFQQNVPISGLVTLQNAYRTISDWFGSQQ